MPIQEVFFDEKAGGGEIVVIKTYDSTLHVRRSTRSATMQSQRSLKVYWTKGRLWKPTSETKTFGRLSKKVREKTGTVFSYLVVQ